MDYYADMHIEIDGNTNVYTAHETAHQVKDLMLHSGLHIKDTLIHVEPYMDDQKCGKYI
ncbi:Dimerisation domain of Zinc Transporter [Pedobacter westerhofensis]|uniref:Dimerisation domain of Zinc Transporter n=2 Tax=Pedobacter westerhofensis TaxID=425512 RepID=A0A521FLM0_9SPHI|nr:Dimerisation domain of Zinc Transporter [Pedobacter westerhofensis]